MAIVCPFTEILQYELSDFRLFREPYLERGQMFCYQDPLIDGEWVQCPYVNNGDLDQIVRLPIDELNPREDVDEKEHRSREYADWVSSGCIFYPIRVLQQYGGELDIYNGHHRWLAARMAGHTHIWCRVSWLIAIPGETRLSKTLNYHLLQSMYSTKEITTS